MILSNINLSLNIDIFDITPKLPKAALNRIIEPLTFLFNETIKKV